MAVSPFTRDKAHARIYDHWRALPAWRCLSCAARALLLEFMCDYRPALSNNGRLQMSVRRAAEVINVGKDTAAHALLELEIAGWLTVERLGTFGRRNAPTEYALTMYANDVTAMPGSFAFEHFEPSGTLSHARRTSVRPQVRGSPDSGTQPSGYRDTKPKKYGPAQVSDALRNSPTFKDLAKLASKRGN